MTVLALAAGTVPALPAWLAVVPVTPGRDTARSWARQELSKPEYQLDQPGWAERAWTWLRERLAELLDLAAAAAPGGVFGLVVIVLLVVAAIVALRLTVGPLARSGRAEAPLFVGGVRSAADHRAAADAHAARDEWADALRERLRAVIRDLEERGLLDARPGRTADEAAREAGRALPGCADDLAAAARVFDDVWYGARRATAEHDRSLRELDDRVRAARPVLDRPQPDATQDATR